MKFYVRYAIGDSLNPGRALLKLSWRLVAVFLLFILENNPATAQSLSVKDSTCGNDSVCLRDSLKYYRLIKQFAEKHRVTKMLYGSIFKDPPAPCIDSSGKPCVNPKQVYYKEFQGKVIRSTRIITLDPFGSVREDTLIVTHNFFEKAGNRIHIKSTKRGIRNKLMFTTGDPVDSLKLIESERLLREYPSIRDARVSIPCPNVDGDSVDVLVVVRDLWSIGGDLDVSPTSNSFSADDMNFLGLSNTIRNRITYNLDQPNSFVSAGNYLVANYRRTHISSNLYYTYSEQTKVFGLSVDRPFYSTITKWAGGLSLNENRIPWTTSVNGVEGTVPVAYRISDGWLGRSFNLRKNKAYAYHDPRLILTARIGNVMYYQKPGDQFDPFHVDQNATVCIGSISYSTRSYYKDMNIYRFGRVEDVPEGRLITLIGGYQWADYSQRPYAGFRLAQGYHLYRKGYLGERIEFGSFFDGGMMRKGALNMEVNLLSDLLAYGKWSVRTFVNLRNTLGFNRDPGDYINLNGANGLVGFNSDQLRGTSKAVLDLETVLYTPYRVLEFQFALVAFAGFGRINNSPGELANSVTYQTYGLALLMRNEHLIINNIQVSVNYYPSIPGKGHNSFELNPSTYSELRFNDFSVARPDIITYQ